MEELLVTLAAREVTETSCSEGFALVIYHQSHLS